MSEPRPMNSDLGAALGRVPSGLFILTVRGDDGRATGMLASWVQQAGFEPPMVSVALHKDRYVADWVRAAGRFVLNQVPAGNKTLLRHFGKGFDPGVPAFEGLESTTTIPRAPCWPRRWRISSWSRPARSRGATTPS